MLIAEIGSNHWGNMRVAKNLIRIAHDCGADLIKGQAYHCEDIRSGSMPRAFYKQCALTADQCLELIAYARMLKNDMFFSIFSDGYDRVKLAQRWHKLSASQTSSGHYNRDLDKDTAFISVNAKTIDDGRVPWVRFASILYATDYLEKDVKLDRIHKLQESVTPGVEVGLSDHTIGTATCLRAIKWHGVRVIEKHFTLTKNVDWGGTIFRDTVHGASPKEFELIAKRLAK